MGKMSEIFPILMFITQVVGFIAIIYKIGSFHGAIKTEITQIKRDQQQDALTMAAHERDDKEDFRSVRDEIADIRVDVARITPKN